MCKLLLLNKICLGARELGYELMDLSKLEVIEMTAGQIKSALKAGKEILGVKVSAGNELELDKEKYFMTNLMRKVHINKLEPVYESENTLANIFFYVVGVSVKDGKQYFNVVNSRFGRTKMTEEMIKAYYPIGVIAGGVQVVNEEVIISELIKSPDKVDEKKSESVKVVEQEGKLEQSASDKVENPLNDTIVSVEITKVNKSDSTAKTFKSKK